MSIFDADSGYNPLPWLQEKTLSTLREAARLIDLANEPDTTRWYQKKLREHAGRLIGWMAPAVVLLHRASGDASKHEEWAPILAGGSFALARWCKQWGIGDPAEAAFAALAPDRSKEEADEKAEEPLSEEEEIDAEGLRDLDRRLNIYSSTARRLLQDDLSPPARRIMLWLLAELWLAPQADIITVDKRFFPGDTGSTVEETTAGYRELYEQGLIERVEGSPKRKAGGLLLRIIVGGLNEPKHPVPYQEETFGFPGARIAGQRTIGNSCFVRLPSTLAAVLTRWPGATISEHLHALRDRIQEALGRERVYIEQVEIRTLGEEPTIHVSLRQLYDERDEALVKLMQPVAEAWLRDQIMRPGSA